MRAAIRTALLPPLLLIGGVFSLYLGHESAQNAQALADRGRLVKAVVDEVQKEKDLLGNDQSFIVNIRFETEDKQTIRGRISVPKDRNVLGPDAGTLAVRYLPERPKTFMLEGSGEGSEALYLMGGVLAGVGGLLLAVRLIPQRSANR